MAVEVSIIIPTYNRGKQILNLLESLEQQTYKDFEVIVVNDGSTDDTLNILFEYKKTTPLILQIVDSENRGRAGARNYGASKANGDLFIFFDDDVTPVENAIESHFIFFQNSNQKNYIMSGICAYDTKKFSLDFHYYRNNLEESWYDLEKSLTINKSLRINGANFSIPKQLFKKLNGFDERLLDKEDFKLAFDANKRFNTKVYANSSIVVFHNDFKSLSVYIQRAQESRNEEQKLKQIDPDIEIFQPERFVTKPKNPLKKIFFTFFKSPFLIKFLSNARVIMLFPKSIRYKLYDFAITANVTYIDL